MLFKKKETPGRVASRLQKLPDHDLIAWADQAIYAVGRNLTAYQRERAPEYLEEAAMGAQVLLEAVNEIGRRSAP